MAGVSLLVATTFALTACGQRGPDGITRGAIAKSPRTGEVGGAAPQSASVVTEPLDASRFLVDPCAVVTPAQLAPYGVSRTGRADTTSASATSSGPGCIWFGQEEANTISVRWLTGNRNGLSDTYSLQEDFDTWDQFEPTEVDGYPAVFNNSAIETEHGTCNLVVGTSDTLAFAVLLQGAGSIDGETACDRVMQVATAVIKMLKENP